jgi:hypothetical protein
VPFAEYKFSKKGMSFGDIVEGKHWDLIYREGTLLNYIYYQTSYNKGGGVVLWWVISTY